MVELFLLTIDFEADEPGIIYKKDANKSKNITVSELGDYTPAVEIPVLSDGVVEMRPGYSSGLDCWYLVEEII